MLPQMGSMLIGLQEKHKVLTQRKLKKQCRGLGWAKAFGSASPGGGYHGDPGVEVRSESRLYCCRSVCLEWSEGQAGGGTREP